MRARWLAFDFILAVNFSVKDFSSGGLRLVAPNGTGSHLLNSNTGSYCIHSLSKKHNSSTLHDHEKNNNMTVYVRIVGIMFAQSSSYKGNCIYKNV